MRRSIILFGGLVVVLAAVNGLVATKERLVASGTRVYLKLAPVDPRSLIQGDYMQLRYALAAEIEEHRDWPDDGRVVVRLGADRVAELARLDGGEALAPGELAVRYRRRGYSVRVGSEAFFFQEGRRELYQRASYGELVVGGRGESVLVGLRDGDLAQLGTPLH